MTAVNTFRSRQNRQVRPLCARVEPVGSSRQPGSRLGLRRHHLWADGRSLRQSQVLEVNMQILWETTMTRAHTIIVSAFAAARDHQCLGRREF